MTFFFLYHGLYSGTFPAQLMNPWLGCWNVSVQFFFFFFFMWKFHSKGHQPMVYFDWWLQFTLLLLLFFNWQASSHSSGRAEFYKSSRYLLLIMVNQELKFNNTELCLMIVSDSIHETNSSTTLRNFVYCVHIELAPHGLGTYKLSWFYLLVLYWQNVLWVSQVYPHHQTIDSWSAHKPQGSAKTGGESAHTKLAFWRTVKISGFEILRSSKRNTVGTLPPVLALPCGLCADRESMV